MNRAARIARHLSARTPVSSSAPRTAARTVAVCRTDTATDTIAVHFSTRAAVTPRGSAPAREDHREDVRAWLSEPALFREANLIGARWHSVADCDSATIIPVTNPSTGAVIGHIPAIAHSALDDVITLSHNAQRAWSAKTGKERGEILKRWYELVRQHETDIGTILSLEQGKPLAEAIGEVQYAAGFLDVYSVEASRQYGEVIPSPSPSSRIMVSYQSVGVVGAITPWNFPAAMITRKVGAAIAAGCSVVLKPSELTPFTAFALADLALRAGLPPGVLQLVTGDAEMIGRSLTTHPLIRKIAFTGSTRVGKLLIEQSASTVKRTSMELGGNAPFIVFADADIAAAVDGIISNKFRNCGQTCVTANRIFVHAAIYDTVASQVAARVQAIKVGDGMAQGVQAGPLINESAVKKVEEHVSDALAKGGKLLAGGKRLTHADSDAIPAADRGLFYAPTVIANATSDMLAFREETFGPIAFLYSFTDSEAALDSANDTNAGLAAYVYTANTRLIARCLDRLSYGMIGVNQPGVSVPTAPFGGMKESGFGREGSHHGLKDYLEMKTFHIAV